MAKDVIIACDFSSKEDTFAFLDKFTDVKPFRFLCRFDNGNMHVEGIRGDTVIDGRSCKRYGYVNNEGAFHGWASLYQDCKRLYRYDESKMEFAGAYYAFNNS